MSKLTQNITDLQSVLDRVNALPEAVEQVAPSISVNASGLITATAGAMSSTHQLAFQPAKTITPTTANQIAVSSGYYTGGSVTVKGDSNLIAGNIKSGVSIFGVSGTYEGSGGDTSVEDGLITRTLTSYTNSAVSSIGANAFNGCTSLTTVSFPMATYIGTYAFSGCFNLKSLYLTGSSVCSLAHSNAFLSTPIGGYSTSAGTYGSIYVPASLLASYKSATNWAYFSSRFVSI